ncbi:hypothetical protein M942_05230 [Enterobacter ludwigii]|nr:hypothetical protein M942_05230 [Enterobacter ludwigii]
MKRFLIFISQAALPFLIERLIALIHLIALSFLTQ